MLIWVYNKNVADWSDYQKWQDLRPFIGDFSSR